MIFRKKTSLSRCVEEGPFAQIAQKYEIHDKIAKYVLTDKEKLYIINVILKWGRMALKIALLPNADRDKGLLHTRKVVELLKPECKVYAEKCFEGLLGCDEFCSGAEMFRQCDIVLALGGDGTLLSAAGKAAPFGKPVLGINMGRLGFLTGSELNCFLAGGFKRLLGSLEIQERMMLQASVKDGDETGQVFHCLNDVVVTRTNFARIGNIQVKVDGELLGEYRADGVIVSTPTGSTGYSLSAGGPILDPELEAMIITPICSHMLHARPIVVPPSKTITLLRAPGDHTDFAITADGQEGCLLESVQTLEIKKSEMCTQLIKINDRSFYELLRDKLHYREAGKNADETKTP